MNMMIRKMLDTDHIDKIASIYVLSWKVAYRGIMPDQYLNHLSKTSWMDALAIADWETYVAIEKDRYIGTSSICAARDQTMSGWGEIVSIYFLPEVWGKGYGQALLDEAMSELEKLGYDKVYLWVLKENKRARTFYEKNNFVATNDETVINIAGKDLVEMRYIYEP